MITLWGRTNAYNVQKVQWLVEELDVEYEHVNVGDSQGDLDSEEFLALNPNRRIPVIKDNACIVWESNTIIRYLAATYGANDYWAKSPVDRSIFERWMDWELSTLQPLFLDLFWEFYRTPKNKRDKENIEHIRQRCENCIGVLDSHLKKHKYVSGDKFGLGDICVGTCFYRYFNMGIDVKRPNYVNGWYAQLSERPSYKKVIQVPFDELRGRLEF